MIEYLEEPFLHTELRLRPNHVIHDLTSLHLRGEPLPLIGYRLRRHADGLCYWIFWNPSIPEVAEADETFREVHGLILLVSGPEWPDKMHSFNTDLLMATLPQNVIMPFDEKWKYIRHMLKRLELERNGRRFPRFLFSIILPEHVRIGNNRRRVTLAHDFAMAGTIFLAGQLECRLNHLEVNGIVDEVPLRPQEFIFVELSSSQIRLTFGEEFCDLRERVLATWICKQMSRRAGGENQLARPRWWMTYSFEAPPQGKRMQSIKGIFVTWTLERPQGDEESFNILLCLIAVSFRPFLRRAISQLRFHQSHDIASRVDGLYRL